MTTKLPPQSSRDEARREPPRAAALVTGAARRLGREIALGLARAGWDVAVHYGSSTEESRATVADIESLGRRAVAVQADLADEAQTGAMFDRALAELGGIRCLVNSASRFEFDRPESFGYQALFEHVGPNLAAPLALARRLHDSIDEGEQGVVINLLDQKLDNLNPDFFSLHADQGGAAGRHADDGAGLRTATEGRGRVARHHADLGRPERGRLQARAPDGAARPIVHPRGHRG